MTEKTPSSSKVGVRPECGLDAAVLVGGEPVLKAASTR